MSPALAGFDIRISNLEYATKNFKYLWLGVWPLESGHYLLFGAWCLVITLVESTITDH
jgi:hypothetical protein